MQRRWHRQPALRSVRRAYFDLVRAEHFDENRNRMGHADRVRNLHFAAVGQTRRDDVFLATQRAAYARKLMMSETRIR
jgi:hypothetical protein